MLRGLAIITGGSALTWDTQSLCTRTPNFSTNSHATLKRTYKNMDTHVCTHMQGFVWECIHVSEGYCFIRANFIQLLSDITPWEKHIQTHTYASPPGLREIIVYLHKCSGEREKTSPFCAVSQSASYSHSELFARGQMESQSNCGCLASISLCWANSSVKIIVIAHSSLCFKSCSWYEP